MLADLAQLRKGVTEFALLALLARQPGHGYELVARLARTHTLAISENTIYPVLARIKTRGWARTRTEASAEGPPRKVLELTAAGRIRLREWRTAWDLLTMDVAALSTNEPEDEEESPP